jgi:hypothetical protein
MAKLKLFNGNGKLTIVLGSGLHRHVFCNKKSALTNWGELLKGVSRGNFKSTENYILDFEAIVHNKTISQNKVAANRIEADLLKTLAKKLEIEQTRALSAYSKKYPLFLFDPDRVSDVISLNFDLIPELLLAGIHLPKVKQKSHGEYYQKDSNSCRHREINKIRFWHPHGDIQKPSSMLLGHRKYALQLSEVEQMRKYNKAKAPRKIPITWYDALTNNTVLIIGAGLNHVELDLWTALVNRERNFAKRDNHKKHRRPVYLMTDTNDYSNLSPWLMPLFNTNHCYEKQWNLIEKMFKKQTKKPTK